ncbi:SDR family NAD(P)-dependent oxidoreductase [Streptomyces sp. NPDC017991]|uniref:SDR family NAD(P)-dependent oxidoreductase n=1 Tax=Streptomyces sp. NPDC017991 TaxID=3365026 RepID=UPI0037AD2B3C
MGQLEGKTAVVTGGSTGIGLATARRLAAEGAHVFITGRRKGELDEAVEAIGPERTTAVAGDISDLADLDRLYDAVRARGRGLDVVFANAGTASFATLEQITEEHFDRIFGVNVRGTVFTVQKALPLLNDGASVILNSSVRADDGVAAFGVYAASKAAIRSFARTWANELKDRGIRVNAISPGTIDTPGLDAVVATPSTPDTTDTTDTTGTAGAGETAGTSDASGTSDAPVTKAQFAAAVPLGRIGRPDEVADAVAFLASGQSGFILGANLYVDGGENQI